MKDVHRNWDTDDLTASQMSAYYNTVLGGWFSELEEVGEIGIDN